MSQPAGLDVRWPLGLLFVLLGVLLLGYGLSLEPVAATAFTGEPLGTQMAPDVINMTWGAVLLLFGAVVLYLARRGRKERSDS